MKGFKEVEREELKNTFSIKGTHLFSTKKKMDLVREGLKKMVNYTCVWTRICNGSGILKYN